MHGKLFEVHVELVGKVRRHVEDSLNQDCPKRRKLAEEIIEILDATIPGLTIQQWNNISRAIADNTDSHNLN